MKTAPAQSRHTITRRLRNAVLRLLRPAEAAARRLIIAAARGILVPAPPLDRPRRLAPLTVAEPARTRAISVALALPLFDPLPRAHRPSGSARDLPRISLPGLFERRPLPVPPGADDRLDATRLGLRLAALAAALEDLPRQALRFARLQARTARRRVMRWPLRPGRPRGLRMRGAGSLREVQAVLAGAHSLAWYALEHPNTS